MLRGIPDAGGRTARDAPGMPLWMLTIVVLLVIWVAGSVVIGATARHLMRREPRTL
jgi:hypothetical protein